jgi:hypothetical protein
VKVGLLLSVSAKLYMYYWAYLHSCAVERVCTVVVFITRLNSCEDFHHKVEFMRGDKSASRCKQSMQCTNEGCSKRVVHHTGWTSACHFVQQILLEQEGVGSACHFVQQFCLSRMGLQQVCMGRSIAVGHCRDSGSTCSFS